VLKFKIGAITDRDLGQFEKHKEIVAKATFADLNNLLRLLLVLEGDMKVYPLPETAMLLALCKWCGESQTVAVQSEPVEKIEPEEKEEVEVDVVAEEKNLAIVEKEEEKILRKVKKTSQSQFTLEEVQQNWNVFLGRVRPINAHVVALLRSTRPTEIADDTLVLEVFFRFHKDKLGERKILDMLCTQLTEVIGTPVNIELRLAEKSTKPTTAVTKSDVVEVPRGDDLSKIAEEIFLK
ncbi:hypothetical protein HY024_02610, partial [Candidatus Curtissbacteria bacterium]|nr:hypothetical protein [Candidatus Curtissbacteria bacterium]